MTRIQVNGVGYEVRTGGRGGPPLLLIHGFTGRGSDWAPFLPSLRRVTTTISVDLLGHGRSESPRDPARHAVERQAEDLAAMLRGLAAAPADVVGYSLGARVAIRMAVAAPDVVGRLILESPSAGIADPADRAARRAADEQLAQLLDREGLSAFVDRWENLPLFASEGSLSAGARARLHAARLRNRAQGLAASLRGAGQGAMEPLHDRLSSIAAPTLVIGGSLDDTGSDRARKVAAAIPAAELAVVAGVGHAPHREAPARLRLLFLDFIERTPR